MRERERERERRGRNGAEGVWGVCKEGEERGTWL